MKLKSVFVSASDGGLLLVKWRRDRVCTKVMPKVNLKP